MSQAEIKLACSVCGSTEGYLKACHFCKNTICTSHAHFMSVKDESVHGVSFRTIRVCKDCMPRR